MTRGRHCRRRCLPGFTLLVLAWSGGGVALVAWSSTGGGSGDATTATTLAVTLAPGTPTAGLYPGGTGDVDLTITNPNPYAVTVGSLALDTNHGAGGFAVDGGHVGCPASALTFATQTNHGAGWSVPGRLAGVDGSRTVTLAGALAMDADAGNACQGMTATVYLVAGG
jgi:hypothetical protein